MAFHNKKENSIKDPRLTDLIYIRSIECLLMMVWRPFQILHRTIIHEILCARVCTSFVRECEILSPTFEAMSPNPTDSEKAIVKAGSARRLGQLFTRDWSVKLHHDFGELKYAQYFPRISAHGRSSKANISGILENVEMSLMSQGITYLNAEIFIRRDPSGDFNCLNLDYGERCKITLFSFPKRALENPEIQFYYSIFIVSF